MVDHTGMQCGGAPLEGAGLLEEGGATWDGGACQGEAATKAGVERCRAMELAERSIGRQFLGCIPGMPAQSAPAGKDCQSSWGGICGAARPQERRSMRRRRVGELQRRRERTRHFVCVSDSLFSVC